MNDINVTAEISIEVDEIVEAVLDSSDFESKIASAIEEGFDEREPTASEGYVDDGLSDLRGEYESVELDVQELKESVEELQERPQSEAMLSPEELEELRAMMAAVRALSACFSSIEAVELASVDEELPPAAEEVLADAIIGAMEE